MGIPWLEQEPSLCPYTLQIESANERRILLEIRRKACKKEGSTGELLATVLEMLG